jgi:hypothetical protein
VAGWEGSICELESVAGNIIYITQQQQQLCDLIIIIRERKTIYNTERLENNINKLVTDMGKRDDMRRYRVEVGCP